MKHLISSIFILACVTAPAFGKNRVPLDMAAVQERNAANRRALVATIRAVDLKAGVTQRQADAIAQVYFQSYISGCGAAAPAVDHGILWQVTPLMGIAGTPDQNPIVIEKYTGKVSWASGPVFATVAELLAGAP
jgi:hypothetical protein